MSAHRRDEYLQAARIMIDPDRVQIELELTPGIAVVDGIVPAIDLDANGIIDTSEWRTYTQHVLEDLTLDIDGRPLRLAVVIEVTPTMASMRDGEGAMRMNLMATLADLTDGPHRLHYRNTHRSDIGVYLANALVPTSDQVRITSQHRDGEQHDLAIVYVLGTADASRRTMWLAMGAASVLFGVVTFWWNRSHA